MKNLECSSKGDKRFSAFYAKVSVFGKVDSIENHYQNCKRKVINGCVYKCKKGERVDFMVLANKKLDVKYLTPYYKLLWCKYLDENPDLVKYAEGFNKFSDMFRGRSINCQADVIRDYVLYGREYVLNEGKEFIEILKSK